MPVPVPVPASLPPTQHVPSLDLALTALLPQLCSCILQWLGLPQPQGILCVSLWVQHSPQCEWEGTVSVSLFLTQGRLSAPGGCL